MWYLIDMDDGILDTADTKKKLVLRNALTNITVEGKIDDKSYYMSHPDEDGSGGSYFIFSSMNQAISAGFDHFFNNGYGRYISENGRTNNPALWHTNNCNVCDLCGTVRCPYLGKDVSDSEMAFCDHLRRVE